MDAERIKSFIQSAKTLLDNVTSVMLRIGISVVVLFLYFNYFLPTSPIMSIFDIIRIIPFIFLLYYLIRFIIGFIIDSD